MPPHQRSVALHEGFVQAPVLHANGFVMSETEHSSGVAHVSHAV